MTGRHVRLWGGLAIGLMTVLGGLSVDARPAAPAPPHPAPDAPASGRAPRDTPPGPAAATADEPSEGTGGGAPAEPPPGSSSPVVEPSPAVPAEPHATPGGPQPAGAPAASAQPAVSAAASRCDPNWFTRVYARTHRSVVRIEMGGGLGAGFVFHSPRHIATAYHVISLGRPIEVTLADGGRVGAQVVATDPDNDVAILELDEAQAGLRPLQPGPAERVPLGAPVIVIGHPYALDTSGRYEGLLNWSVSQGIVSGRGTHEIQTDAAVNPGNSGGPLLDCEGRVLGVVSAKLYAEGIGFVIPINRAQELVSNIGKVEPELDAWQFSLNAALAIHANPDEALVGFGAGLSAILYDSWTGTLRAGLLWGSAQEEAAPFVLDRSLSRSMFELEFGHRWLVLTSPFPLYLGLNVGGALGSTTEAQRTISATVGPEGCTGSACQVNLAIAETEEERWMGWPIAGLQGQAFGILDVSYALLPDVRDFTTSLHRVLLGLSF